MAPKAVVVFLSILLLTAGCVFTAAQKLSQPSTAPQKVAAQAPPDNKSQTVLADLPYQAATNNPLAQRRDRCPSPEHWLAYQMQLNETVYSLAARANISAEDLLESNCLTDASALDSSSWLYVPPQALHNTPRTFLPLGISALVADPPVVAAGGTVQLTWQAQGPVVQVRLGWTYQKQFIEEATNLPQIGTWQLQVPADGRESITFVVRASDGLHEVAAQTTVQISCPESWFFNPQPPGCPSAPLITTFREQRFERGTIVYIPALGLHYVLIINRPGTRLNDTFVPGMPLKDAALDATIPAGLFQPSGPINYAWNSNETLHGALGYAVAPEISYMGMLQRVVGPGGETIYFSASSGHVYRFVNGRAWQVIAPQ